MANPFDIAVPNVLQSLMAGNEAYKQTRDYRKQEELQAARQGAAQDFAAGNHQSALAKLMNIGDTQGMTAIANVFNNQADRDWRRQEADRAQKNQDRSFGLQEKQFNATIEGSKVMPGWQRTPQGGLAPTPGGPNDPAYLRAVNAEKAAARDLSSTDKKAIFEAEDETAKLRSTIDVLNRAKELAPKAFTGYGANWLGSIGTSVPGAGYVLDEGKSKATVELGQILSGEAIKNMSQTLKGASTDREMAEFQRIISDPKLPVDLKLKSIERMQTLASRQQQILDARMNQLRGGNYYKQGGGMSGQPSQAPAQQQTGSPLDAARAAIARGADRNAVMQRLQQNGIDPSGL